MSSPVPLSPSQRQHVRSARGRRSLPAVAALAILVLAACSGDDGGGDTAPATTDAVTTTTTEPPTVQQQVANLLLGHLNNIGMSHDEPCIRTVSDLYTDADAELILEAGLDSTPTLSDEGNEVTDAYLDCLVVSAADPDPDDGLLAEPVDPSDGE